MAYFTFTQRPQFSFLFPGLKYICRQVDPNNGGPISTIISKPTKYEVITTTWGWKSTLHTRVLSYDKKQLSGTEKYATASYTFASVEFYAGGYYKGSAFITKEFAETVPNNNFGSLSGASANTEIPAPLALAMVTNAGFIPSLHLVAAQPIDPQDPNPNLVGLEWFVYYIIPAPSVVIEVMFP